MAAERSPVQNIINRLHERELLDDAKAVARAYHLTIHEMLGRGRQPQIIKARHALIKLWCVDKHLDNSFVGRLLDMDPSSVLYVKRKAMGQSTVSTGGQQHGLGRSTA